MQFNYNFFIIFLFLLPDSRTTELKEEPLKQFVGSVIYLNCVLQPTE